MSLSSALNVGRSALAASQAALQVAGQNMANAATEGYHRRSIHMTPMQGERIINNQFVGRGVKIDAIHREIDVALQARYRDAVSDENAASMSQNILAEMESIQNELSDNDLSSMMSEFYNAFSELANNPTDTATRVVVIELGQSISGRVQEMESEYRRVQQGIDRRLGDTVEQVNGLLDEIGDITQQIVSAEHGLGEASDLRDQRDLLIDELAEYMDITVIDAPNGSQDILVNSTPILLAGQSRGVELRAEAVNGEPRVSIRVADDGSTIDVRSGTIGGLLRARDDDTIQPAMDSLESFASSFIQEVNRLHTQGQGLVGFESVTGTTGVPDTTVNLNTATADLPFRIENGSMLVSMTHAGTGQRTEYRIDVDGDAMSLDDLLADFNATVPNATATLNGDGHVILTADAGYEITFGEDSSGALTALGINTFFQGENAGTMEVNDLLLARPEMLAVGGNHIPGSNDTALAIAAMRDAPVDALGGSTLSSYWQNSVSSVAVKRGSAQSDLNAARLVKDNLGAQIQAVSGVSLDEEAINLLTFQRQFQAAARFISVIDETLQTLISIA